MPGLYRVGGARRSHRNKPVGGYFDLLELTPLSGGKKVKAITKADTIDEGDFVTVIGKYPGAPGYMAVKKRKSDNPIVKY